jgi:hypothetical protein
MVWHYNCSEESESLFMAIKTYFQHHGAGHIRNDPAVLSAEGNE